MGPKTWAWTILTRTSTPFFGGPFPLVFAHRGGCDLGPENTLLAFDLGLAAGADGLELDVHLSHDGVAVVHHDDDARSDDERDRSNCRPNGG